MLSESKNLWLSKRHQKTSFVRATPNSFKSCWGKGKTAAMTKPTNPTSMNACGMPSATQSWSSHLNLKMQWNYYLYESINLWNSWLTRKGGMESYTSFPWSHFFGCDNMSSNTHLQCIVEYLWCLHGAWQLTLVRWPSNCPTSHHGIGGRAHFKPIPLLQIGLNLYNKTYDV